MYDLLRWRQWFSLEWPSLYIVRRAAIFIRAFTCFFRNSIILVLGEYTFLTLSISKVAVSYAGNVQMIILCSSINLLSVISDSGTWEFGFNKWNFYNLAYFGVDKVKHSMVFFELDLFCYVTTLILSDQRKRVFIYTQTRINWFRCYEIHESLCT